MSQLERIVIVGASLAGAKAAEGLRERGYDGALTLVGEEPELPYERPPLSKEYLQGKAEREAAQVHEAGWYPENEVELRTGTRVALIDPGARRVELADGERLPYDRLLLTTGGVARPLSLPGAEREGVHLLRTVGDSERLRATIGRIGRLTVIGAGWIGCEVAAAARVAGVEVTMIERLGQPLEGVLGPEAGAMFGALHRDHGVELLTGVEVKGLEGDATVRAVSLADGRRIDCDAVVAGVGARPRTELAEAAGLELDDGIATDAQLRTSAEGVFAAGDCAAAFHPLYGRRVRVEHWANALNQGAFAAGALLGDEAPYERVPYFFSDQYDLGLEYSGLARPDDRVVVRGDAAAREVIVLWLRDDRVVAGMNVNVWDVTEPIQALARSGRPVDAARLADPAVPLDELAGT